MNKTFFSKKILLFNPFILGILFLILLFSLYYIYSRERTASEKFAVLLVEEIPYWKDKAVRIGDRDVTSSGRAVVSYDQTKRDVELTLELVADQIGDSYYFQKTQAVKTGQPIDLHFTDISLWKLTVISFK